MSEMTFAELRAAFEEKGALTHEETCRLFWIAAFLASKARDHWSQVDPLTWAEQHADKILKEAADK